ncbi:hypothetical protein [Pendulispora albinea]|uniref:PEGA domain-containing protein n=1 Tax=Pendulispora albinea TaxID=2741071 RepID=A0ABZ2LQ66_9BACT
MLHSRKEFGAAARQFALADQLVPNDFVLADAIDSSVAADEPALGSMLVARAARNPQNAELQHASRKAKEKFYGRAGRIEIRCPQHCEAEIDGKPLDPSDEGWLTAGPHTISLITNSYPGYRDEHHVEITSAGATSVVLRPPTPVAQPKRAERHGPSPVWFWIGAGTTAVLAGGAVLSWFDTKGTHRDFLDQGCAQKTSDDCNRKADDGKGSLLRTNILLGGAIASAALTAAVGIFLVDWKPRGGDSALRPELTVGPQGAGAALRGGF